MKRILLLILLVLLVNACSKDEQHYQGYVEGENIYLASPFGGKLIQMLVTRGLQVKKGDLLFILDPKPQSINVDQLEASLISSKQTLIDLIKPKRQEEIDAIKAQIGQVNAQIDLAQVRVERYGILVKKNAVDKDTYDSMVEKLRELKDLKKQYEANLDLALLGARINQINSQAAQMESVRIRYIKMATDRKENLCSNRWSDF